MDAPERFMHKYRLQKRYNFKISRMVTRESDESFEKLSENEMSKNLYHQLPSILYTMDKTASLIIKKSST